MTFESDEIAQDGPDDLVAEHQLLLAWITQHPLEGVREYLRHRLIDKETHVALYYIRGHGMGHGQSFALVSGQEIYTFMACRGKPSHSGHDAIGVNVLEISVPEGATLVDARLQQMIVTALASYGKYVGFLWGNFYPSDHEHAISFANTRWIVRPKKYSRLYWKEKARVWWNKRKPNLSKLQGVLTSPLAALFTFAASLALSSSTSDTTIAILAVIASGAWLMWRLMQYDCYYVTGYWFVGIPKLKHPLLVHEIIGRRLQPKPLPALTVRVEFLNPCPSACVIHVKNTTLFPVSHLSISSHVLADLLAPGFRDSLRAKNAGAINTEDVEAVYPTLEKKWLLPWQSVAWRLPLLGEHPLLELKREIEAIVTISRYVSGEPRGGASTFLLPIGERTP